MRFEIGAYVYWSRPGDALRSVRRIFEIVDGYKGSPIPWGGHRNETYRIRDTTDRSYQHQVKGDELEPVPPLLQLGLQAD